MVVKWLTSYFGTKQDKPSAASNSNAKGRGYALEDLALIYEGREDWEKALDAWGQVLVQEPRRVRAMIGRGYVLTRLNLPDLATSAYGQAAAFDSIEDVVAENAPDGDEVRKKAIWSIRRQRWQESLGFWSDILDRYPLSLEAALHLGQCLMELGEIAQARSIYADLIQAFSDRAGPWQGLLRIGVHERNWALSDIAYDKCLELGGHGLEVVKQCLDYKIARRAFAVTEDLIAERFSAFDPIETLIARISVEMARPNLPRALELIATGEREYPDRSRRFRNKRSDCVARLGRFEDVLKILDQNFEDMRAGVPATRRFIRACIEAGRVKKASRMINAIPEEWYADRNLSSAIAWNFVMQGEPDHARQAWQVVPYRPKLQLHKTMQVRLNRVRWPETVSGQARVRLYCVADDSLADMPSFLEYYRAIGVEEFFFIDDGLLVADRASILAQKDCVLFESVGTRQDHCFGAYWVNWLRDSYRHEGWDLFVVQNMYLTLPDLEALGLQAHLDLMEARSEEVLSAVCLFMYDVDASRRAGDIRFGEAGESSLMFDTRLRIHQSLYCPYTADIQQYGRTITDPMDVQHICAPLLRSDVDISFLSGNRMTTPASVSSMRGAVLDCRPPTSHLNGEKSAEISVDRPGFVRYEGTQQLEILGILKRVAP